MKCGKDKACLTIGLLLCAVGLFAGCGSNQAGEGTESGGGSKAEETPSEAVQTGDMTELPGGAYVSDESADDGKEKSFDSDDMDDTGSQPGRQEQLNDFPSDTVNAAEADEGVVEEAAIGKSLTTDEMLEYTDWVQEPSNYGFLLSEWQSPEQINLFEVFYNGAGISREGTEEEKQAFLDRHGWERIETDFFAMDKEDVSALLLERAGLSYDEILAKGNNSLEEIYFPETDSFCLEVGDTNRIQFICTDGVENAEGTIVTLYFQGSDWVKECEVRVMKDGRQILSNHIMEGDILSVQ